MPALLFDLDGTLVDSVYQHVLAWREALEKTGMKLAGMENSPPHRHEWGLAHKRVAARDRTSSNR